MKECVISADFHLVLVIVDHFTKGAYFIPRRESMNAAALAVLLVQQFFRVQGLPDKIVSDRGPYLVPVFWLAVPQALFIKSAPLTAYHPEPDGQTKRTNQTMATYSRHFVSHWQDDWMEWFPVAEFCFNNPMSSSTTSSPFLRGKVFILALTVLLLPPKYRARMIL